MTILHPHPTVNSVLPSAITQREGNAIQYAAGYVCKKLRKKIESSKHEYKEEMILCLG